MDQSTEVEVDYSVRAFLLYMFMRSVFSAKSDRIYLNFLLALNDLTRVSTYGWGRSAIGWMYSNMGKVANGEKVIFLGLHFLWEVRCLKNFVFVVVFFLLLFILFCLILN